MYECAGEQGTSSGHCDGRRVEVQDIHLGTDSQGAGDTGGEEGELCISNCMDLDCRRQSRSTKLVGLVAVADLQSAKKKKYWCVSGPRSSGDWRQVNRGMRQDEGVWWVDGEWQETEAKINCGEAGMMSREGLKSLKTSCGKYINELIL